MGVVVVSHSAKLAEGVVELARQMGDGAVGLAAAGGIDDPADPIGTDAFRIKEAIEAVWSADGVLVLMDLGSAIMNAETALELVDSPVDPSRVLLCEAPLVEGAVAAVATARLGASLSEVADEARAGLTPKVEHLSPAPAPTFPGPLPSEAAPTMRVAVSNFLGLHLRPAARLVELVGRFDAEVTVANATTGSGPVPARSLSRVSSLGVRQGHTLEVQAEGPQAGEVLRAVEALAAEDFGDRHTASVPRPEPRPTPPGRAGERTITGLGASPGVAVAPARRLRRPRLEVPDHPPASPGAEKARLARALAAVREDIDRQHALALGRVGEEEAEIFAAHLLILEDQEMSAGALRRIDPTTGAERAWSATVEAVAGGFRALEDPYQAERAVDVEAVGHQVLARLLDADPRPAMAEPGVLVADDLTPGEAALLDPAFVSAIVTAAGSPTSHSAILARGLGVPAVVAAGPIDVEEGTLLLVDGSAGTVVVRPRSQEVREAEERAAAERNRVEEARRRAVHPAVTRDGVAIEVAANIGSVEEAAAAVEAGADGVGLLRTEFLFLDRRESPGEEEQEDTYRRVAAALDGRPLVLRTLDAGGDKPLPFLARSPEANPFLGVRGLRLGLAHPDLLLAQLRAVLRVAAEHPLRIMFPMVASLTEWEQARALVADAAAAVGGLPAHLQLGVMVEIPALALAAEHLAGVVDFFSVGTNDLTQYTLAAERGNPALAPLADGLHPAVLALIAGTCRAAAEHGRWVGVCGELAADPAAVPVLLGLGVRELSMNPVSIPLIKDVVRRVDLGTARELAEEVLAQAGAPQVRERAARYLGEREA